MIRRIQMDVRIDRTELQRHVDRSHEGGDGGPYSTDPAKWDASDIFNMADRGILDPDGSTFTDLGEVGG